MLTFLSDFGTVDGYSSVMKGVAGGITDCRLVDITHDIPSQDVWKAAYVYLTTAGYYPSGTVHVGVVDPGVGTEREGIVVEVGGQCFVGPDNGLFIPVARSLGDFSVYVIEDSRFLLDDVSDTFHGRDVFSAVGAWLTTGVGPGEVGCETGRYEEIGFGGWSQKGGVLNGVVINIDRFGNVVTNIPSKEVCGLDFGEDVFVGEWEVPYRRCYGEVEVGGGLLTTGSHGYLEVSVNQGSAEKYFGVERGDSITIVI
ncbi:S-adenosyl-l-methionine hydroxide adenosyltransferase [Methanonatronarchaeum thermophilum]|uniref:S-adenosyl-l-methionine hydroxide adenosyltransferase n=1 Tax=Methanonatronarchaeum thermophilum TaxID=1927129 RepID=A0A1Y3G9V8_9EURY|nr:SAM-dependent chlorinase/fluorinase [Methanonatronarchaeum thermophilum]OUJ18232.1 S-adenosyl-l-methionine hydroxide adenosyltransferase [Methanonatronarchaeum thermophilum]